MIEIALVLALATSHATHHEKPAPEVPAITSFMGIPIGASASELHECPIQIIGAMPQYRIEGNPVYDLSSSGLPCWMGATPGKAMEGPLVSVIPKDINRPNGTGEVYAHVIGETIEGVLVNTSGLRSQDDLFAQLQAKFGPPVTILRMEVQTLMGVKATKITAKWVSSNGVTVNFSGMGDSIDKGSINVETKVGEAALSGSVTKKSF
jgi:hypothetical protein